MPTPSRYALIWSEMQHKYELQLQRQRVDCFSPGDALAFSRWLEEHTSFAFLGKSGRLSVIKEARQRGTGYWYAYRKQNQRTHKRYLGPSTRVTFAVLEEEARRLSSASFLVQQSERKAPPSERGEDVILSLRLAIPRLPSFFVERARLQSVLDAILSFPLTVVSASAGSGKTTLLSSWALASSVPQGQVKSKWAERMVAWLSLDALDNDPVRFWSLIIAALRRRGTCVPSFGEKTLALLHSSQPHSLLTMMASLLDEFQEIDQKLILILDDYHVIKEQALVETLHFFLDHLPADLHLVLASRTEPQLPLSRFRVRGQLLEIGSSDLRFTREEATSFLVHHMNLPLTEDEVAQLSARTEGWIAGLHLAALALRKQQDLSGAVSTFAGYSRFVLDYVQQEILARIPVSLQHFLLQTSILSRMNAAICQAVTGANRVQESQQMLEELEQANLFLAPLDSERQWYRYHDLFREVLLARLHLTNPDLVPFLHQRAARWYEAQGLLEEAIAHALEAGDAAFAALLLERFIVPQSWCNEYHILHSFLARLPQEVLAARPDLSLSYGIARVLTGERGPRALERVEESLQWAERGYRETFNQAGLGAVWISRAALLAQRGEFARAFALAREALNRLPEQDRMWRGHGLVVIGIELLCSGRLDQAEQFLRQGLALYEASGTLPGMLIATVMLGEVALSGGDLHAAEHTFRRVLALSDEQQTLRQSQLTSQIGTHERYYERLALYDLAQLAYDWNKLEQAEQLLQEAQADGWLVWPHLLTPGNLLHARLLVATRRFQGAQDFLNELASHNQPPEILREIAWCRAFVALSRGDLAATEQWAASLPQTRPLPLPRWEEEMLLLARLRIAQSQPYEALNVLIGVKREANGERRKRSALQIILLEAVALEASGDRIQAKETLMQACRQAHLQGYLRLFLDEGPVIETLLKALVRDRKAAGLSSFLRTLLRAFADAHGDASTPQSQPPSWLAEPLTPQEQRVLQLLAAGSSNQEIANHLIVSLTTVKKHVANILAKLGAQNRTQAVALAREYALL
ncbi:LuxR C-terminal-related transcriptional regulator [Ktedonosporobacter rubrisoli]|nr:LuxR C-terminal-related transcriptional regulator [Ktedonosporobacter rubrisoli]